MTKLLGAYVALGLPAGSSLADVMRRHRWLACAFHPDRMPESKKGAAEQEMKRINNARDEICTHYARCHQRNEERCYCEPFYSNYTPPNPGTGAGERGCKGWGEEPTGYDAGNHGSHPGKQATERRSSATADGAPPTSSEKEPAPPPDKSCDAIDRWAWRLLWPLLICLALMTYCEQLHEAASTEPPEVGIYR